MSNIKDRATALSNRKCSIPGCDRPAQALAAPDSRATALCRKHLKHRARHGSAWRKSFTAEELDPYRKTASRWLTANRQAPMVQHVLTALAGMMANAGKAESAYDLNRVKPEKRAKIALARLREAKVAPETLLINAMAVWALFEAEDMDERMPGIPGGPDRQARAPACQRHAADPHGIADASEISAICWPCSPAPRQDDRRQSRPDCRAGRPRRSWPW